MTTPTQTLTNEEFWAITQLPENTNKRLELVDGVIVEKGGDDTLASSNRRNTITAMRIGRFLGNFVDEHQLGYIVGADSGFELGPGHIRQPDVAFIVKERVPTLEGTTFAGAPDLAVEVISPNENSRQIVDKVRAYLESGADTVWNVYADARVVDVYRLNEEGSLILDTFTENDVLTLDNLLPDFELRVRDIFPQEYNKESQ